MPVRPKASWTLRAVEIASLAIAYAIVGRLGLKLDAVAGFATLVWPPTGIALAALLLRGRTLWPGVAIGAFVVNVSVGGHPLVALGIAGGNTLEAIAGAALLQRLRLDARLERVSDVMKLVLGAAVLSSAISATIGVATLRAGGIVQANATGSAWFAWWLGDAMGDLVVAPLVLTWLATPWKGPIRRARALEAALLLVAGALAGSAVFAGWIAPSQAGPFMYLVFPPVIWAAVSFQQRGATAGVFCISAFAIAGTAMGQGPFVRTTLLLGLFELQSFLAVVAVVLLLLAAAVSERDRARRAALAAVRGRDEFLAIASHELRTPLGALGLQLAGISRSVRSSGKPPEGALEAKVALAERQSDRLTALVNNLLDVSRIDADTLVLNPERIDLAALVRDVVGRLRDDADRASCALEVEVEEPSFVTCDPVRVEQVIVNLLSNAFRHGAGEDVGVKLWRDRGRVRFTVTDRGEGIESERLETIFARFDRGAQRTEGGGLGLGLYISRRLAQAHGGRLFAENGSRRGAVFTLDLPETHATEARLEKP